MFRNISIEDRNDDAQAIIVGQFQGESLDAGTLALDDDGCLARAAARPEATGELGRITSAFHHHDEPGDRRFIIVGLGSRASFQHTRMTTAGAAIAKALSTIKATTATIQLAHAIVHAGADAMRAGNALGEGLSLACFDRDQFKGAAGSASSRQRRPDLDLACDDASFAAGLARGLGLGASANYARLVSETPPNICTPTAIAAEAQRLARQHRSLKCTVFKGDALHKEKFAGLFNVGQASEHEPCMVRLEYTPPSPKRGAKKVVLVGKTMTYDSGGLSIKVNGGMRGMKRDKDGGCAVLGAMHAIATVIQPRVPVVALLACAENAISDEAYRPDDIITFRNGVTVEVTNTDAEGRLVLADALCWACDSEQPGCIIDVATLTGGVVVALGSTFAGLWCDDDALRAALDDASAKSGERLWRLPHHDEYRDLMKSDVADIVNSAPVRKAHPIQGAAFLSYFVEPGIPWAHIDIAGVHAVEGESAPYAKNSATGFGVRLLAELVDAM
ncbi:MAG: leucyl aminopeptidase family protein [Phycisphaerales bacterium]